MLAAGLNHALHELELAFTKVQNGIVGIYGAGGEDAGAGSSLKSYVEGELGGKMFKHWQHSKIMNYLKAAADQGFDLNIYGYSRGGRRAIIIANQLGKLGINIDVLTTFDPHIVGGGKFYLKFNNVRYAENHYQRNKITWGPFPFGNNPYQGSPVTSNFILGGVNQFNYTGTSANHINIIKYAGY